MRIKGLYLYTITAACNTRIILIITINIHSPHRYTMEVEHLQSELSRGEVAKKQMEAEHRRALDAHIKERVRKVVNFRDYGRAIDTGEGSTLVQGLYLYVIAIGVRLVIRTLKDCISMSLQSYQTMRIGCERSCLVVLFPWLSQAFITIIYHNHRIMTPALVYSHSRMTRWINCRKLLRNSMPCKPRPGMDRPGK